MTVDRAADFYPRDHYVYRLFAADGRLLYVGASVNLRARQRDHSRKPWWGDVDRWQVQGPFTRTVALDREREAIISEKPTHNIAHALTHCKYGHSLADAYVYRDGSNYLRRDCRPCALERKWQRRRNKALNRADGRHLAVVPSERITA